MKSILFSLLAAPLCLILVSPAAANKETKAAIKTFVVTETPNITTVTIESVEDVFVNDDDRAAILTKINARMAMRNPAPTVSAPSYKMEVMITRYKRGSAAARMSLIGLGSIKIEGAVTLFNPDGSKAGEYDVTKGLVLGGIAGGLSTANGVHDRFANSVVAGIMPKLVDKSAKAKNK